MPTNPNAGLPVQAQLNAMYNAMVTLGNAVNQLNSGNYAGFQFTCAGDGTTTVFSFPHNMNINGTPPNHTTSIDTASTSFPYFSSTADNENITVTFLTAPNIGDVILINVVAIVNIAPVA